MTGLCMDVLEQSMFFFQFNLTLPQKLHFSINFCQMIHNQKDHLLNFCLFQPIHGNSKSMYIAFYLSLLMSFFRLFIENLHFLLNIILLLSMLSMPFLLIPLSSFFSSQFFIFFFNHLLKYFFVIQFPFQYSIKLFLIPIEIPLISRLNRYFIQLLILNSLIHLFISIFPNIL